MAALLHKKMLLVGILELTFIQFALSALPTFITPDIGGSTSPRAVDENAPPGNSILLVEGQDADGDNLTYSIQLQNPISPAFEINTTSGLFKTPSGLDAEFAQQYTLRFGISDGGAVQESVDFIVNINDLNDNAPVFNPSTYSNSTLDSVAIGTSLVTVIATDADVTAQFNTIAYSISSGDTNSLFTVGGSSGILTTTKVLTGQNGTYTLTVQASDGPFSDTATVTVTVEDDPCAPDPCVNGNCSIDGDTYICTCDAGFTGRNCAEVDFCYWSPCLEGSTCMLNNTYNYTCTCQGGFLGRNCEQVDFCYSSPCLEGSTCMLNSTYNYTCICQDGFLGRNCEQVDYCYTNPCLENSTCVLNSTYNYTCTCTDGFLGRNCEQVDYCNSSPCKAGSTCSLNSTYNYTCNCVDGYLGRNCDEVDYCNANPCNGGSCTNTGTGIGYTCDCSGTGLGGQNCTDATTTASTTNGPTTTTTTPSSSSSSTSTPASAIEQRGGGGSSGGGLSAGGIAGIVIAVIVVLAIVIVLIVVYLHKRVPVCGPIIEGCLSDRTNSNDDTDKPIEKRDKMELVVTGVGDTTTTTTTTANKTQDTSRSDKYRTENENISTTNAEADEKVTKNGKLGDKQGDSVSQGQDMAKDSEHENTDADVKDNGKTKSDERERNTSDTEIPLLDKKQDEKSGIKL